MLEETLESPLGCKEIQPVNPQGNQSWIFTGRTDAKAETPILWPPDENNWLIWKCPDAGKDWRQEEKETTEDKIVGWHHWLNGHEFEQALGVGDGQGSLVCCCPWGRKESDTNEQQNWSDRVLCAKLFQPCPTFCVPMDYSLPAFSVDRILQVRTLEWFDKASFRGSSRPRDPTHVYYVSCTGRQFFTRRATWEAQRS